AVLHLSSELEVAPEDYEFQRLHGMRMGLHGILAADHGTRTRIYAPVGRHADLLAYLVRRLLENGANGSFVNLIADRSVPAAEVSGDPFAVDSGASSPVKRPADLFAPRRRNSRGLDLADPLAVAGMEAARERFAELTWT